MGTFVTVYPGSLRHYARWSVQPCGAERSLFFASFEDGLRALLRHLDTPRPGPVLFPSYYCEDTLRCVRSMGYEVARYPLSEQLEIQKQVFKDLMSHYKPALVCVFHVLGITSSLCKDQSWLSLLPQQCVVLEDCAHRLVSPKSEQFFYSRQVRIDSLRKVLPLHGAHLWASAPDLFPGVRLRRYLSLYRLRLSWLHMAWRCALDVATGLGSASLLKWGERFFYRYDELVGSATVPAPGSIIDRILFRFVDIGPVRSMRSRVASWYAEKLPDLCKRDPRFFLVSLEAGDHGNLKAYPLGVRLSSLEELQGLISYLYSRGMMIDAQYPESPHCRGVYYLALPIVPLLSEGQVAGIVNTLAAYAKE